MKLVTQISQYAYYPFLPADMTWTIKLMGKYIVKAPNRQLT